MHLQLNNSHFRELYQQEYPKMDQKMYSKRRIQLTIRSPWFAIMITVPLNKQTYLTKFEWDRTLRVTSLPNQTSPDTVK